MLGTKFAPGRSDKIHLNPECGRFQFPQWSPEPLAPLTNTKRRAKAPGCSQTSRRINQTGIFIQMPRGRPASSYG